jgi:hypothetical protein
MAAIESGAALAPIVAQLASRQAERDALLSEIGAANAVGQLHVDRRAIKLKVLKQVETWRALLTTNTTNIADGRQFLREALDGPIDSRERAGNIGSLGSSRLSVSSRGSSVCRLPPFVASPTGFSAGGYWPLSVEGYVDLRAI